MTMTKKKGQMSDWKAPKLRPQRSRKRKAEEADDHLIQQNNNDLSVTETKTQDADNINSNSQNVSVSEAALQEHPGASTETTELSCTAEDTELGDAVALSDKGVSSGMEPGDTVTSEAQEHKAIPSEGLDAQSISTKERQLNHSATSSEHVSRGLNQTEASDQTSSLRAIDPSLDEQATSRGSSPTMSEEKLRGEVETHNLHHHPPKLRGEGEEAAHLPREERPELGCEASSQGTDGGDPADPPARKKVKKRMGMGRLRGEMKKEEGQNFSWRKNGGKDRGGERDVETDEKLGVKVMNDGPSLSEKQGTVHLVVAQFESNTALKHNSTETECSGLTNRNDSASGWCDVKNTKVQEPVAIATTEASRTIQHSEMVTREEDSVGPSKIVGNKEQRDIISANEIHPKESEGLHKSAEEDNNEGAKFSHCQSANIKPTSQSTDVGEATAGNQIQKPAVTAATAAKHNIPDGLHKEEGAHHSDSDDVLKSTKGTGTLGCDSVTSHSSTLEPNEPTAPSSGEESNMCSVLEESPVPKVKGHDHEKLTDITPDLCHDPNPFDPSSVNTVTDSQLNDITLIMELEDQHIPESSGDHEDATELVCGLIRELSALNRTIMAAHRELESVRRGNWTGKTPQRQPFTPRHPET